MSNAIDIFNRVLIILTYVNHLATSSATGKEESNFTTVDLDAPEYRRPFDTPAGVSVNSHCCRLVKH